MRYILVSILLLSVFAAKAHGTNHQEKDALQQLGQKAVLVIKKKTTESLNGYLLIVCKASGWKALAKDSDLGPFLKYKKAAGNLDAVVAMPANAKDGSTYGVYFEDGKPNGFVEIKTGKGEKLTEANVAKGYAPVGEDSASGATDQIRFEAVEVFTDDNTPIPTLKVVSDGQGVPANQQGDYRSGAIKSATGYVLVWNQPNNYYVLEINGKDVRQTSTERKFFSVDGMFLQIVDAAIGDVVQAAQRQKMNEREILEAHRDWEAKFMEGEYKAKLKVEHSWQKLNNGKDALLWHASLPETATGNVKKQVYLSVVQGDYVLMLGGAVTDTYGERVTQLLLLNTMQTLKTSNKPTDLQKVRDAIRKKLQVVV
jgi:uncharacterized protein involved in high-affinity Fe2+ transport